MQAAVALCYFHRKIGPIIHYTYPERGLSDEETDRLADVMDQSYEEGFFTHKFGTTTMMNYYFEILSDWARGGKEMLMISFLIDFTPKSDIELQVKNLCIEFAVKLQNNSQIYKSFYFQDEKFATPEEMPSIHNNNKSLKFWVKELYWVGIEELRERTEEEKWAKVLAKPQNFKTIKKLSKGPQSMDDMTTWFSQKFPLESFMLVIDELQKEKFIFVNSIGQDSYILLVKDVIVTRIPPDCVIDIEEDANTSAELTEIYITEVKNFFEKYEPSRNDSLILFQLFADPKTYNVISQLREGPLPKNKILELVSENSKKILLDNLIRLSTHYIISDFTLKGESYYLLKTDVVLTASFPKYLKQLLPKETKGYRARAYEHRSKISQPKPIESPPLAMYSDFYADLLDMDSLTESFRIEAEEYEATSHPEELPNRHYHLDFIAEDAVAQQHIAMIQRDLLKTMENDEDLTIEREVQKKEKTKEKNKSDR